MKNNRTFAIQCLLVLCFLVQMICGCNNSNRVEVNDVENKDINKKLTINDTLKLSAYFDECGEFGGHREQIKIYNVRDTISIKGIEVLGADFLIDTMTCNSKRKRVFKKVKTRILNDNDKTLILNYMSDLLQHSFDEGFYSNAGRVYAVECEIPKISIFYTDDQQQWNGFYRMKNSLFGKL